VPLHARPYAAALDDPNLNANTTRVMFAIRSMYCVANVEKLLVVGETNPEELIAALRTCHMIACSILVDCVSTLLVWAGLVMFLDIFGALSLPPQLSQSSPYPSEHEYLQPTVRMFCQCGKLPCNRCR
jgi:hypothetical protein